MKIQQWLFKLLRKQNVTDGRTDARTHGRTDGRTDNVKTVYPLQTKFAGGKEDLSFEKKISVEPVQTKIINSFMHMFNVSTLYRQSIKLLHQELW